MAARIGAVKVGRCRCGSRRREGWPRALRARDDFLDEQLEACLVRFHLVFRGHSLPRANERVRVQVRNRACAVFEALEDRLQALAGLRHHLRECPAAEYGRHVVHDRAY